MRTSRPSPARSQGTDAHCRASAPRRSGHEGIEFLGRVADVERDRLLGGARALLFPGEEDFGIVPVEAQAAGVPVIAYGVGGATESVLDGQTGVLFAEQDARSLADAIERFEQLDLDEQKVRENARRFGRERFHREMAEAIDTAWRARADAREKPVRQARPEP